VRKHEGGIEVAFLRSSFRDGSIAEEVHCSDVSRLERLFEPVRDGPAVEIDEPEVEIELALGGAPQSEGKDRCQREREEHANQEGGPIPYPLPKILLCDGSRCPALG
jgi:hypothetical protein